MSAPLSAHALALLQEIAEKGEIELLEGSFSELEAHGLVTTDVTGSHWGYTESAKLNNNGRRFLGLPVITPPPRKTIRTRIRELFGVLAK